MGLLRLWSYLTQAKQLRCTKHVLIIVIWFASTHECLTLTLVFASVMKLFIVVVAAVPGVLMLDAEVCAPFIVLLTLITSVAYVLTLLPMVLSSPLTVDS